MLKFILAVSVLADGCCNIYIGTFANCDVAQAYYDHYLAQDYSGYSCLYEDYTVLPKGFEHRYISLPLSLRSSNADR